MTQVEPDRAHGPDALSAPFTPGVPTNPPELARVPRDPRRPAPDPAGGPAHAGLRREVAQRLLQLLLLRPQVLPRGLPGHAGRAQRVVDADGLPRQRRRDGAGRPRHRRRGRRLRELHPVRRVRAALPEHPVHRRLLPVPHPHGRRRQGGARARRRQRGPPAGLAVLERAHRPAHPRAGARRDPGRPGHGAELGGGARPADRRRDGPVRRLRGRVLPDVGAAGGGPDAAGRRLRVRPDGRPVVLRRPGRGDGLRRAGAALRPAQPRRLAGHRHEAGAGARPARLHQLHRGLPEVLRRGVRHRGRPGPGPARAA